MPLLIETKDDAVLPDKTPDFSGGVNSFARPSVLAPNQLAFGRNIDISIEGRVITRRGTIAAGSGLTNPIQGIAFYSTDMAIPPTYPNNLVVVENGLLKIWDGAAWQAPGAAYGGGIANPVIMAQMTNLLYLAQDGTFLKTFDGATCVLVPNGAPTTAPVKPRIIAVHTDRLMAAGIPNAPEILSMSQIGNGAVWDHSNWDTAIGDGDGDPIVQIVPWTNFNLAVLKRNSTWMINCNPINGDPITGNIAAFPVTTVHRKIGCIAPMSAAQVGADVFFLSNSGVRGVARTLASENQNVVGPPISEPITDIINRINPAAYATIVGYYWKNKYILALPLDSSTYPNYVAIFNTLTNSWSGYWDGITPTCFTTKIHLDGTARLTFGQHDGKVVDFMDYVLESVETEDAYKDPSDNAFPTVNKVGYPTELVSRGFTCGDDDSLKTGLFGRMEFNISLATITVSVIRDGNPPLVAETFSTQNSLLIIPFLIPFTLPAGGLLPKSIDIMRFGQWLRLQLKIATTTGKLSINRLSIGAFMDSFTIQE